MCRYDTISNFGWDSTLGHLFACSSVSKQIKQQVTDDILIRELLLLTKPVMTQKFEYCTNTDW